ncbi:hypothetical protein NSR00_17730 [Aeribacillus sp. FSL K6-8394]|uniref:hypothetical protein n=1 Tax=Aeribacillus sp. FSL K6-8394 TaxID=2954570 RepID=UPI0030F6754C
MGSKRIDITGKKFGRLTVIEYTYTKGKIAYWRCLCECGNETIVMGANLRHGKTKSCGCIHKKIRSNLSFKHGQADTRLFKIWSNMKDRCENPHNKRYDRYGGRGIKVCDEWHEFKNFYDWAINNGYNDQLTIERKDINKNYEPDNCEWIPQSKQAKNRSSNIKVTIDGETKILMDWSRKTGINYGTLKGRYKRGDRGKRLIRPVERTRAK